MARRQPAPPPSGEPTEAAARGASAAQRRKWYLNSPDWAVVSMNDRRTLEMLALAGIAVVTVRRGTTVARKGQYRVLQEVHPATFAPRWAYIVAHHMLGWAVPDDVAVTVLRNLRLGTDEDRAAAVSIARLGAPIVSTFGGPCVDASDLR